MNLINKDSLAATLDALNEAFFCAQSLLEFEREQAAQWIASRQGKVGAYADMFAPTKSDFEGGIRLFTGERLRSRGGTAHILGEEACRALILLNIPVNGVRTALDRASHGMMDRLKTVEETHSISGWYCCGTCTASLWRHLAVGGLEDAQRRLEAGMKVLKHYRDGSGGWRRFPFYYTLLSLSEIALPSAVEEMRYASPICERYLKRAPKKDSYSQRRHIVAERILERC